MCSRTTRSTRRPRSGWSASSVPVRPAPWPSAGCSSAGRAASRNRRRRDGGRPRCAARPIAWTGLEGPLGRYLLELEADQAEGRSWYGAPGAAELLEWEPILKRAGVHASAIRVAQTYLELAVFVRALQGLADTARIRASLDRSSLWAGLFDLRENLLGRTLEDLRALAA